VADVEVEEAVVGVLEDDKFAGVAAPTQAALERAAQ